MLKKLLVGFTAGIICGLFTAGGGLILEMEPKQARATSLFCILPMVIVTAIFYGTHNFINWKTGILCAIGGIIGGAVGAKILDKIQDKYLKAIFIFFLIYAGVNMIFKT